MNQGVTECSAIGDDVTDADVTSSNVTSDDVMGKW
jgi:hypothetical protein